MGFFSIFNSSNNKSKKLKDLSKRLVQASNPTVNVLQMMHQSSDRKEILEELFEMCENDEKISLILEKHSATRKDLENIYVIFMMYGGNKWTRGHYVPTSVIAFADPLDYCLSKDLKSASEAMETVDRLIKYFKKGEVGFPID